MASSFGGRTVHWARRGLAIHILLLILMPLCVYHIFGSLSILEILVIDGIPIVVTVLLMFNYGITGAMIAALGAFLYGIGFISPLFGYGYESFPMPYSVEYLSMFGLPTIDFIVLLFIWSKLEYRTI